MFQETVDSRNQFGSDIGFWNGPAPQEKGK